MVRGNFDFAGRSYDAFIRAALLALLVIGIAGLAIELLLIGHYDEIWQIVPLALLGVGLLACLGVWARANPGTIRFFQAIMLSFIVAGALGVWRHYAGNAEFELERHADLKGLKLVWESARGATPLLAPLALAQLGLIGLVYTFRHPALDRLNPQPLSGDR